ncbi:MAG TPA: bacteriohopanetetrol glucosamine biosynthesis glycosyltransferase HpnI, partial [Acetobacteraceae bacterium]|nr:bacteriohopanetetrol glucosamine biosynthesis glycosyltransferase HpnI [Acetobacteraceae bacterium]
MLPAMLHAALVDLAVLADVMALLGMAQAFAGWALARRLASRLVETDGVSLLPRALPPISVLKPLYGDEPLLEEALASFITQNYPGFQLIFGVRDPADPALAVVARLRARHPAADIAVVVDPRLHGANGKVSNLINMMGAARHDILVIADSDIHAAPGHLRRVVEALLQPGVGLATTLYTGRPAASGLAGRLGCSYIGHTFLPGALVGRALGRQDCLGATMALRRATLEAAGGFPALLDQIADDAVLGQMVRAQGLRVALAATVPATTVAETTLPALLRHELRWARTTRSLAPLGFAASVVQYPLVWAALAILLAAATSGMLWALTIAVMVWAARACAASGIDAALG